MKRSANSQKTVWYIITVICILFALIGIIGILFVHSYVSLLFGISICILAILSFLIQERIYRKFSQLLQKRHKAWLLTILLIVFCIATLSIKYWIGVFNQHDMILCMLTVTALRNIIDLHTILRNF